MNISQGHKECAITIYDTVKSPSIAFVLHGKRKRKGTAYAINHPTHAYGNNFLVTSKAVEKKTTLGIGNFGR